VSRRIVPFFQALSEHGVGPLRAFPRAGPAPENEVGRAPGNLQRPDAAQFFARQAGKAAPTKTRPLAFDDHLPFRPGILSHFRRLRT
jgi:hypothetical protein